MPSDFEQKCSWKSWKIIDKTEQNSILYIQNISIQSKCSRDVLGRVWVKKLHPLQPETINLKGLKL